MGTSIKNVLAVVRMGTSIYGILLIDGYLRILPRARSARGGELIYCIPDCGCYIIDLLYSAGGCCGS